MTEVNHTANITFAATKRVERKSTGLIECVIFSLAGMAITVLLMAHGAPTAMQLTVMQ